MKRSTGKTSALGILVFSHFFRLRFAGMHVRAIELPAETERVSIRKFNALRQHDLHNHRLWGSHPSHPWYFLSNSIAINKKWILSLFIPSYGQYFQGASSWPFWWSSLSFPSFYIASALQHLTSTIWSTGLPKTHHSFPSLCQTISNRDTDVLILNFCCTE